MGVYLDTDNRFHRAGATTSLQCPHCGIHAHMRVGSVPDFTQMQIHRPKQVGIALHCEACNMPVFLRYGVKDYRARQIEFFTSGHQIERPTETFSYDYLPALVADAFKDALGCYTNSLLTAFAVMCRRTVLAAFDELGEQGKIKCYEQVNEIQQLANIDAGDFDMVRTIIFETDLAKTTDIAKINPMQAAILLETMRDMLYQVFVRGGKLQKALQLRRYFAEQAEQHNEAGAAAQETTTVPDNDSIIVRAMKRANGN